VLPFWEGLAEAADPGRLKELIADVLKSGDFTGKTGEGALCYSPEGRLLLLGLGKPEKATVESLRRSYANAARVGQGKKVKSLQLLFPKIKGLQKDDVFRGICEGILLSNYTFTYAKDTPPVVLLEELSFVGLEKTASLEEVEKIVGGVHFVRELVNGNADDKTPKMLAETAKNLESLYPKIKTTIFDKKKLEQEKMGLILAVNRASSLDPFLIQVAYKGNPKSKEHIVLVGKGITYDTGGLSLKPTDNMLTMKSDMSGAATVLGAVQTAAALGLKVNVTAVAPVAENCIGSKSYKLGDVYRSYSGKTVEVNNTDAEGRLVLADALSFAAQNLKPTCMIDIASLTGSIVVALGDDIAGFFTQDEAISKDLMESSEKTGENLWRMPLCSDYKESLKSEIADLINTSGRDAGSVKAALFLQEFVGTVPWVHIDFAGPCYVPKPKYYNTTHATGYGLRLLVDFLSRRSG